MSDRRIVFVRTLIMAPPGKVIYHNAAPRKWDVTECGRRISHVLYLQGTSDPDRWDNDMIPLRRDLADLIGRPCASCRWRDW